MTPSRRVLPVAVAGLLAACTGSTDPTTATLFDNVQNLSSGEYDRQIAAKEAEAAALARENTAQRQQVAALEQQRNQNAASIASLQGSVGAARRQAVAARATLAQDSAGNAGELAQLQRLEVQLDGVEADVRSGGDPAVLQSEIGRISGAIRALSS